MKSLVVLAVALVVLHVAAADEWIPITHEEQFSKIDTLCKTAQGNVTVYEGEAAKKERDLKILLCKVKHMGTFDEEKGYDVDRLIRLLNAIGIKTEDARTMVTSCVDNNEQKSSAGEWAWRGNSCLFSSRWNELVYQSLLGKNIEDNESNDVAAADEWKPITTDEEMKRIENLCTTEQGNVVADESEAAKRERNLKILLCKVKHAGTFSEEKGFNVDRLIRQLTAIGIELDLARTMVTSCVDKNEQMSSAAEWSHRGHRCIFSDKWNVSDQRFKRYK